MNEQDFIVVLQEALAIYMDEDENVIKRIQTLEDAGVLTSNIGLVISARDGSEFQLTIVQSK